MRGIVQQLVIVSILISLPVHAAYAAWVENGVTLTRAPDPKPFSYKIVYDTAGGAIIVWEDHRNGQTNGTYDIYAQRIDDRGYPLWDHDGVLICGNAEHQMDPEIIRDGSGGAIISWLDERNGPGNYDIYAQRIDSDGVVQWAVDGVPVCTHASSQESHRMATGGSAAGAFIVWADYRSGSSLDIFAQRIDSTGTVQWASGGVAICTDAALQQKPVIKRDGSDGVFIAWVDERNGASNDDIYAQRIDAGGTVQWAADGVPVCTNTYIQADVRMVYDRAGGAILTWSDARNLSDFDIYAQRINGSGLAQWTADGVSVCTETGNQVFPEPVYDNSGGVILTWQDQRVPDDYNIYAQRINSSGTSLWAAGGVSVCSAATDQWFPQISPDGSGGALIVWEDYRNAHSRDVYTQRIDDTGSALWTADGIAASTYSGEGDGVPLIVRDGSEGAIIVWREGDPVDPGYDIVVQRILASGYIDWTTDGKSLFSGNKVQYEPSSTPDGSGRVIVTWVESYSGRQFICTQLLDQAGDLPWSDEAVIVCSEPGSKYYPKTTSDGAGGAIMAWQDGRNGQNDIFTQRVGADGTLQWADAGVEICTAAENQHIAWIGPDGSGGAIVVWADDRAGLSERGIYAQRVNASGSAMWATDGVPVYTGSDFWGNLVCVSDGSGGAILAWGDYSNGSSDVNVHSQRINSNGAVQWAAGGNVVCDAALNQDDFHIASDGYGGAIITWNDLRNGTDSDIYAQRVDSGGVMQWADNGIVVCDEGYYQEWPRIVADGSGGAVIAWSDYRNGTDYDIFAQSIDHSGAARWAANGVPLCEAAMDQGGIDVSIAPDGSGGAIVSWRDVRNGSYWAIFAQLIDAGGNVQWQADGEAVCTESSEKYDLDISSDDEGGAYILWADDRSGWSEYRAYANRITSYGYAPICSVSPDSIVIPLPVQVGTAVDTSFTISNAGLAPLVGGVGEPPCGDFTIISGSGQYYLLSGESHVVTVRFEPSTPGAHQCTIDTGVYICGDVTITAQAYSCPPGNILYVDQDASGDGSGGSWADAMSSLQGALEKALLCPAVDEIWVAEGKYTPTSTSDRTASFELRDGLALYGGFAGGETTLGERDWEANLTVLSGDIGVIDDHDDNSYHVVTGDGVDSTAVLDGFKVMSGAAHGVSEAALGGGMCLVDSSPKVSNTTFQWNTAELNGGGVYCTNDDPIFTNVRFVGNNAGMHGGGMYSYNGSPVLTGATFLGNYASDSGGGLYNRDTYPYGSPVITNVVFKDNTAAVMGGGMWTNLGDAVLVNVVFTGNMTYQLGGGLTCGFGSVVLTNVTFNGNTALVNGGGMYVVGEPAMTNCVFWGNTGVGGSNEIYNDGGAPVISYSLVAGCGGSGVGWDSSLGADGGGNVEGDPLFVDVSIDDLRLRPGSPAIDSGDNGAPHLPAKDLAGIDRILNGTVDMGAYEGGFTPVQVTLATVPPGLFVGKDGYGYAAPKTFTAGIGDTISISVTEQQQTGDTLWSFVRWSDGGDAAHDVIAPDTSVTYTAYFATLLEHASIDSVVDVPGDQGGWARVHFTRSIYDDAAETTNPVSRYDIHRRIDDVALAAAILEKGEPLAEDLEVALAEGSRALLLASPEDEGPRYLEYEGSYYILSDGGPMAAPPGLWEVTATVSARQEGQYVSLVPTLGDSSTTVPWSVYYVSAHTTTPAVFFDSPPDSGYSVDNIAPGVPIGMSVAYNTGSGNELVWDLSPEPDFQYYRIYRGGSESFVPGPANLVHQTSSAAWTDPDYDGWDVHYKVTALDHAGNESEAASPATTTGDGLPGVPKEYALHQNAPNPFNPVTTIRFDLPRAGRVRLDVYNVKGERISTLVDGHMAEGRKEIVWSGADGRGRQVTSGVYFYRLVAGEFVETRKMILLR